MRSGGAGGLFANLKGRCEGAGYDQKSNFVPCAPHSEGVKSSMGQGCRLQVKDSFFFFFFISPAPTLLRAANAAVYCQLLRCRDLSQYSSPLMRSPTTRAAHLASCFFYGGCGVTPALLYTILITLFAFKSFFLTWTRV